MVFAHLLRGGQALQLSVAEVVLLLEGGGLQHQMLLLRGVHLLQVLRRRVGSVQRLLEHLHAQEAHDGWLCKCDTRTKREKKKMMSVCGNDESGISKSRCTTTDLMQRAVLCRPSMARNKRHKRAMVHSQS